MYVPGTWYVLMMKNIIPAYLVRIYQLHEHLGNLIESGWRKGGGSIGKDESIARTEGGAERGGVSGPSKNEVSRRV